MFHLTPSNMEGFDAPEELWNEYLRRRVNWVWKPGPYFRVKAELLLLDMDFKKALKLKNKS